MSSTQEQLIKLSRQKKLIATKQKQLRVEFNKGRVERTEANKVKATARKAVRETKTELRELGATIYSEFSRGDTEALDTLADNIETLSAKLVNTVRSFAEAQDKIDGL